MLILQLNSDFEIVIVIVYMFNIIYEVELGLVVLENLVEKIRF